jgi:hypothetical protein
MYGTEKTFLNGWFTLDELLSVLATMENMKKASVENLTGETNHDETN